MTMPERLTIVGDLERPDHYHLPADACCYFWGEYTRHADTGGRRWDYSPTNQLIANFKKRPNRQGCSDWHHKGRAINMVATCFSQSWQWGVLHEKYHPALIPMPPSKPRTDPLFDDRMSKVLTEMATQTGLPLDIRDCLTFSGRYAASHESEERPSPDELYADIAFDEIAGRRNDRPGVIYLFDDMLTTGAHYVAATRKLADVFPGVPIVGNFIARRRIPNPFANVGEFLDF